MRIWSIHPEYLDPKGLVALWREALLARYVIEGKTKGYKNHPQLFRFIKHSNPLDSINHYLFHVFNEATKRGYRFNHAKISLDFIPATLTVTKGQLYYEMEHLLNKLKLRDQHRYYQLISKKKFYPHPMFKLIKGDIEAWEKPRIY